MNKIIRKINTRRKIHKLIDRILTIAFIILIISSLKFSLPIYIIVFFIVLVLLNITLDNNNDNKLFKYLKGIFFDDSNPKLFNELVKESLSIKLVTEGIKTLNIICLFHLGEFEKIENTTRKFNVYNDPVADLSTSLFYECLGAIVSRNEEFYELRIKELKRLNNMAKKARKTKVINVLERFLDRLELYHKVFITKEVITDLDLNEENVPKLHKLFLTYVNGVNALNNHDYLKAKEYFDMIKDENKDLFYVVDSNILLEFINSECIKQENEVNSDSIQ